MASILILDNEPYRREMLIRYLSEAGYGARGIGDEDYDSSMDYSAFGLVIVNLYPDAMRTWDFYMNFKKKYPDLPVLVYLKKSFHAFRSLKQVIGSVLGHPKPPAGCLFSKCTIQADASTML
jgi:DNA-binding NtrC family response regulator